MSWPDGECYSYPSAIPCSLSHLSYPLFFSRIGGVLSHQNSSTHRFPRFPLRNLSFLVTMAVFSRLRCNGHNLLLSSYLSRIGKIENPPFSACGHPSQDTSHLILHCPATTSGPGPRDVARLLGPHGLPPSLGGVGS